MKVNDVLQSLNAVLRERHKPWCVSFKAENSSQDSNYGIVFTVVIAPETDAVLIYEGSGATFDEALDIVQGRIIGGFPKENTGLSD
jgi:hypothetical protein